MTDSACVATPLALPMVAAPCCIVQVLGYFVVTVGFWLYRLNAALGKYDALYIIPMLQACPSTPRGGTRCSSTPSFAGQAPGVLHRRRAGVVHRAGDRGGRALLPGVRLPEGVAGAWPALGPLRACRRH